MIVRLLSQTNVGLCDDCKLMNDDHPIGATMLIHRSYAHVTTNLRHFNIARLQGSSKPHSIPIYL